MTSRKLVTPGAILLACVLIAAPVHAASDSGCQCKAKAADKKIEVIFEQIDQDGDEQISQDELKGFIQFMKALHSMRSMMHGSKKEKKEKKQEKEVKSESEDKQEEESE